jgi:hypothetical protein
LLFVAPFWRAGVSVCECVGVRMRHAYTHTHTHTRALRPVRMVWE